MKPVTLLNIDCIEYMRTVQDKYFDLTLTDFPYGIDENYGQYIDTQENLIWLVNNAMPEILRISRVVALTPGVKNMYLYPKPDWVMAWVTPAGTGNSSWGFCCWQPILLYGKDPYLAKGKGSMPDYFLWTGSAEKTNHPCNKPITIWKKILKRVMIDSGRIFDPFMGSGTTAICAYDYCCEFVGCELDKDYYDAAVKRFNYHKSQVNMFEEK